MLSRELMGALALSILWVNTLLVALATARELGRVLARRRGLGTLRPGEEGVGVVEARVMRGDGSGGALACRRVSQLGREAEGARAAILFADRDYLGASFGGTLDAAGVEIRLLAAPRASVWLEAERVAGAAACPDAASFDEAHAHARRARGFARVLEAPIGPGTRVWILGELRRVDGASVLGAPQGEPLLIAALEPREWCLRKAIFLSAFIALVLAACAVCTALALHAPRFGGVSTAGAALSLAFFLLVQPAATAARDHVREPSRSIVRGRWVRQPEAAPARAARPV